MKKHFISTTPKLLGYLGLIPFIVPTLFLFYDTHHFAMWNHFLLTYGAVILSFVGALHWSFAMSLHDLPVYKQRWSFVWSVMPSLAAWIALSVPKVYGLTLMAVFFVFSLIRDEQLSKQVELAAWYMPLRRNLTAIAISCLFAAAYLTKNKPLVYLI